MVTVDGDLTSGRLLGVYGSTVMSIADSYHASAVERSADSPASPLDNPLSRIPTRGRRRHRPWNRLAREKTRMPPAIDVRRAAAPKAVIASGRRTLLASRRARRIRRAQRRGTGHVKARGRSHHAVNAYSGVLVARRRRP